MQRFFTRDLEYYGGRLGWTVRRKMFVQSANRLYLGNVSIFGYFVLPTIQYIPLMNLQIFDLCRYALIAIVYWNHISVNRS